MCFNERHSNYVRVENSNDLFLIHALYYYICPYTGYIKQHTQNQENTIPLQVPYSNKNNLSATSLDSLQKYKARSDKGK